jgi:hypothetical protein
MNERTKELAEQAGFVVGVSANADRQIKHFAELVDAAAVAREREACAKLCEEFGRNLGAYKAHEDSHDDGWQDACCEIETAIRARGKA